MFQVQCEVIAGKPITDIGATITWTIPNESFSRNAPLQSKQYCVCVAWAADLTVVQWNKSVPVRPAAYDSTALIVAGIKPRFNRKETLTVNKMWYADTHTDTVISQKVYCQNPQDNNISNVWRWAHNDTAYANTALHKYNRMNTKTSGATLPPHPNFTVDPLVICKSDVHTDTIFYVFDI